MSIILPHSVDSAWPSGQETTSSITLLDPFLLKALTLIGVAIAIFGLIRSLNRERKGLSKSKRSDLREFLTDELVFNRLISPLRIITYYSITVMIAIPLFMIVHIGVAISLVLFLLLIITGWIYFDAFVQHTKVVINRIDRTVTLSSSIGNRLIKPETVKPFKELVFDEYSDDGFLKYGLYIDKADSSWAIWDGFSGDEVDLILDWARETSVESFQVED